MHDLSTYMIIEKNVFARCPFYSGKLFFERLFLVYNYFSDCQVIVLPSYRDVHHDYVYPQPPFFHQSQDSRMKAKRDYPVITLLKLSLLFNGSTVQWYLYWSLKYDVLICFLHYVMILLFFTTERSFHARPMCSRHQQCDIWTYFIGRHVSTGSRGNFLVLKLTLLHIKA